MEGPNGYNNSRFCRLSIEISFQLIMENDLIFSRRNQQNIFIRRILHVSSMFCFHLVKLVNCGFNASRIQYNKVLEK